MHPISYNLVSPINIIILRIRQEACKYKMVCCTLDFDNKKNHHINHFKNLISVFHEKLAV